MNATQPTFKDNPWAKPSVTLKALGDGSLIVGSGHTPTPIAANLIDMLKRTVQRFGERTFFAQRNSDDTGWDTLTYQQVDEQTDPIAQWMLSNLPPNRPVMILSHNTFEHALLNFAAMKARLPVAPISPNYSLLSKDHAKVKAIFTQLNPGAVFVQDGAAYDRALKALDLNDTVVIAAQNLPGYVNQGVLVSDMLSTAVTDEVERSVASIDGDDIAKILFTSGSTGNPKGVVNTHTNLCFPQASLITVIGVDPEVNPPILLDWMPWHHTYGGNQNMHRVLKNGGTMYIDDGKPLPGLFEKTLRNMREVPINSYTTVPAVYALLVNAMEKDPALRKAFFSRMEWCSYGGSDMPQDTFDRLQKLAIEETGNRISMITALGSTESAAVMSIVHWPNERMGSVGLPIPGTEFRLVPVGDKFELRVKGPQIMPGYLNNPELNEQAFDERGFFRTGDAVRWADPSKPEQGLIFAGRVSEDFKLLNGTWVHTGMVRTNALSYLAPWVSDLVITGQDKDFLGAMVWLNEDALRKHLGTALEREDLANAPEVRALLAGAFARYNDAHSGSSTRIKRTLILVEPPSLDDGEISDKRYINQSRVQALRADKVADLYLPEPPQHVLTIGNQSSQHAQTNAPATTA